MPMYVFCRSLVLSLVVAALVWVVPVQAQNSSCVVLVYHHFSTETPASTSVSEDLFEQHLRYLKDNDFNVIFMSEAMEYYKQQKPFPDKCVVLTADDAYHTVYTGAIGLLEKYNLPMTLFVTTEGVERGYGAYMTWEQMREIKDTGLIEYGNHSHTHEHYVLRKDGEDGDEYRQRLYDDFTRARDIIERELGGDNRLFAYPYGEYNETIMDILEELGYYGIAQHSGAMSLRSHPMVITRFPMAARFAEMGEFRLKVNSRALPVLSAEPSDPILRDYDNPYELTMELERGSFREGELACYMSFQGQVPVEWLERSDEVGKVRVTTNRPPGLGRTRINCTAPARQGGYFYWYSHPIFNLSDPRALD
ncbi:polysaccharide deacetylase family protein [Desulfurispira natronophila]|uniref:Peptidoglycan/xylan/chitin deacetylase (PgdA/CDA1 family) n=1 Tax=Desulfurispira natronophila TaxID=682562 RepID=A0A7W7Y3T6_9BACT|nr:polysaccharide deacetylase family protein [Desulfurispira natronophila]MBB5021568.1 peptidoglycan/xylan/chitin deacetylase (PgdA/CDA1 family) [Desulfurispira natronophila]